VIVTLEQNVLKGDNPNIQILYEVFADKHIFWLSLLSRKGGCREIFLIIIRKNM
jgi:hypothetical protein